MAVESPAMLSSLGSSARTGALPPLKIKPIAKPAKQEPASVGCGPGSNTKTLFVLQDSHGDADRRASQLADTRDLAARAAARGNNVVFALLGGVVPSAVAPASLCIDAAVAAARTGIKLSDSESVAREDVLLFAGPRELGLLRLANSSATAEVCAAHAANAASVLKRASPHEGYSVSAHDAGVAKFSDDMEGDTLAVAMFLKTNSLTQSIGAGGLIDAIARRLPEQTDPVPMNTLQRFLAANMQFGDCVDALLDGARLTPEGIAVAPAAKAVLKDVLSFANNDLISYLRRAKLAAFVRNGDDDPVFLSALPLAAEKLKGGEQALNTNFNRFLAAFVEGQVDQTVYTQYLDLAAAPPPQLPLPQGCRIGIVASETHTFPIVQRQILVDNSKMMSNETELVGVTGQWVGLSTSSTSSFWAAATWCGSTRADIETSHAQPARASGRKPSQLLYEANVILGSILSCQSEGHNLTGEDIAGVRGIVGPVVTCNKKPLRAVTFTTKNVNFTALFDNEFVEQALDDARTPMRKQAPYVFSNGRIGFSDAQRVPLALPGLTGAENELLSEDLGRQRVFRESGSPLDKSDITFDTLISLADDLEGMQVALVRMSCSRLTIEECAQPPFRIQR